MSDRFTALATATRTVALEGPGRTPAELRASVARGEAPERLAELVEKIRKHAYKVTDEDLDALRAHYSEDELFELIVAAVLGAADERLRAGLAALEGA